MIRRMTVFDHHLIMTISRQSYVADCVACHSTPKSKPFAGGLEMATPLGAIYATNITPDRQPRAVRMGP